MKAKLSTREAAKKLGVTLLTLQRHVSAKTVAAPHCRKLAELRYASGRPATFRKLEKFSRPLDPEEKRRRKKRGKGTSGEPFRYFTKE